MRRRRIRRRLARALRSVARRIDDPTPVVVHLDGDAVARMLMRRPRRD